MTTTTPDTHQTPELRGDEAALYAAYHDRLRRSVARAVRTNDTVIEDACAFAWERLLRCQPDRKTAYAWLRTTAIRQAWREHALQHADRHLDEALCVDGSCATLADQIDGGTIEPQLRAREALRAVARLRPRQRLTFARSLAGLTYREIAHENGLTYRQVDRHLRRASSALRLELTDK